MKKIALILFVISSLTFASTSQPVKKYELPQENIIKNGGIEEGLYKWTYTGTTATLETASPIAGSRSMKFTGTGAGNYVASIGLAVPNDLKGKNCLARAVYTLDGSTAGVKFQVTDTVNVLNEVSLTVQSDAKDTELSFICPTSGNIAIKFVSDGSMGTDVLKFDSTYIGRNYLLGEIGVSEVYGTYTMTGIANCSWDVTSASYATLSADGDCNTPVVTGSVTYIDKTPRVRFSGGPGNYIIEALYTTDTSGGSAGDQCATIMTDGTTNSKELTVYREQLHKLYRNTLFLKETTAFTDKTVELQLRRPSGTTTCRISNSSTADNIQFIITKYPLSNSQVVKPNDQGWYIDANIGGANIALGTSSQTAYIVADNAGLDLVKNGSTANVYIGCSSTNESTGLTCSAGNEQPAISFWVPKSGSYEACVEFGHFMVATNGHAVFQIIETPNNAQTITSEGGSRISVAVTSTDSEKLPLHVCGIFNFASSGKKTLRLATAGAPLF